MQKNIKFGCISYEQENYGRRGSFGECSPSCISLGETLYMFSVDVLRQFISVFESDCLALIWQGFRFHSYKCL